MTKQPRGGAMQDLARLASALARPEAKRRSYWRMLLGFDHWALILIRHAKPGTPPERPRGGPTIRIRPEFARRTDDGLTGEQLIHERISQHLKAYAQDEPTMGVDLAASVATDAVIAALAEHSITLPGLGRHP
jgi:hypothetical protein